MYMKRRRVSSKGVSSKGVSSKGVSSEVVMELSQMHS